MKTCSLIFSLLSLTAFINGFNGAPHQLYVAGVCAAASLALYPWHKKEKNDGR